MVVLFQFCTSRLLKFLPLIKVSKHILLRQLHRLTYDRLELVEMYDGVRVVVETTGVGTGEVLVPVVPLDVAAARPQQEAKLPEVDDRLIWNDLDRDTVDG